VPTAEPDRLRDVLATAYGIIGVVRKRRTVGMVDRTRVHLDDVAGLGTFVELEVVLDDDEPPESGVVEARRLMAALGIQEDQLVSRAYIDLLQSKEVLGTISSW
jgi:predicted adenylyl cyclase CyaB